MDNIFKDLDTNGSKDIGLQLHGSTFYTSL